MNKKELFNILKKVMLGGEKEVFFDIKTSDGKIVRIDGDVLDKGLSVYEILEDGTVAALNDGDYILESGETINVSGGRIADFIPVDAPADEETPAEEVAPEEEVPEDAPADAPVEDAPADIADAPTAEIVDEIAAAEPAEVSDEIDWNEAVQALAEEIVSIKEAVNEMKKKYEDMSSHISTFSALPSDEKLKKEKTGFKQEAENQKDLRSANLEKIRAIRNN